LNKKRVAKEWLYFLGCFLFGLLLPPFLFAVNFEFFKFGSFVGTCKTFSKKLLEDCSMLVDKREALIAWLFVLGPYLLFQLVRSVIWAWKTTRNP